MYHIYFKRTFKYRLGTPSMVCNITELSEGYLPGAGLAFNFAKRGGADGVTVSSEYAFVFSS